MPCSAKYDLIDTPAAQEGGESVLIDGTTGSLEMDFNCWESGYIELLSTGSSTNVAAANQKWYRSRSALGTLNHAPITM